MLYDVKHDVGVVVAHSSCRVIMLPLLLLPLFFTVMDFEKNIKNSHLLLLLFLSGLCVKRRFIH